MLHRLRYAISCCFVASCLLASSCKNDCNEDNICDDGETALGCPGDCAKICNDDGTCGTDETAASCPSDCSTCDGDSVCDPGETAANCASDCSMSGGVTERFVVIGDSGNPGFGQTNVGLGIAAACLTRGGCDYGITNGDNVYPAGALPATDADAAQQWVEHFENAFGGLGFPFHAALGNHDYGGITEIDEVTCGGSTSISCLAAIGNAIQNTTAKATGGIGLNPDRPQGQLDYALTSTVFNMPDLHYTFNTDLIDFAVLDTAPIYWDDANEGKNCSFADQKRLCTLKELLEATDSDNAPKMFQHAEDSRIAQETMMTQARTSNSKRWRIAFGHHPYLSNGQHRNAGTYNGTGGLEGDGLPFGHKLKAFIENHVIKNNYHAYLYGHDHNLQDLGEHTPSDQTRGTQMILSGSASKITDLRPKEGDPDDDDEAQNIEEFQIKCYGFVMVEASNDELRLLFITVPSGEDSACASQTETYKIQHERTISFYQPG